MKRGSYTVLFTLPTLFFGAILLYFVGWNLYYSFLDASPLYVHTTFVGFSTYATILARTDFRNSLIRTLAWSAALVAAANLLGILLAALIYFLKNPRLKTLYTSLFIYPLAVSTAASAIIWTWIFDTREGIDSVFRALGLPTFRFLSNPATETPSLILVSVWIFSGLAAIFYYASFQNVPLEIIESARTDAAGSARILSRLLLPESKNAFIVSTALIFIFALRIFTLPYVSTGLNPFTETLVVYTYYWFYSIYFSNASAVSMIIIVIATVVIIPYALFGLKRWISGE